MVVKIADMVLRIAGLLALILGLVFWVGNVDSGGTLGDVHMLLGIIVVLSLWVLGAVIISTKGGVGFGILAFIFGLIVAGFGASQRSIPPLGNLHWIIKAVHLLF